VSAVQDARHAKPSMLPMAAIGAAAGVLLLVGAVWITRPTEGPVLVEPPPPIATAVIDAGAATPAPEAPDAAVAVAPVPVVDPPVPVPAVRDAGEAKPVPVQVAAPRMLRIEFRIRPFAKVYLDGKELGETPFPAVLVSVGKHKIRLVNAQLKKDLEVDAQFHPGDTSFKYNLKE
jgi:hypothetical protein